LQVANACSLVGNVITAIAVPWFVLATTGSAAKTGLTAFVTALPTAVASIFGGALADRLGHKRISVAADLASGLTVALIPTLYHTVGLAFWQLLVLVFSSSLLDAPGATARTALIPRLAALAHVRLERASAVGESVGRAARVAGAPLGVLLSPSWGRARCSGSTQRRSASPPLSSV